MAGNLNLCRNRVLAFTTLLLGLLLALMGCAPSSSTPTIALTSPASDGQAPPVSSTATSSATLVPTLAPPTTRPPSQTPRPSSTPIPSATHTQLPTLTRTLGPPVTRTPAPPAECPAERAEAPEITSDHAGTGVVAIFETQILDYLNTRGSSTGLEAALAPLTLDIGGGTVWEANAQVVRRDVTGNQTEDVIVYLSFFEAGQYSEGAVFVFQCENAEYVGGAVTVFAGQVLTNDDPDGIRAVQDLNADGVLEIVFSYIQIIGTHAYFIRGFEVLEWDGSEFVELAGTSFGGDGITVDTGDGAVQDTDGDGIHEIVLTNAIAQAYFDMGAQRPRTEIWAWDGYGFSVRCVQHPPPEYRFQAVHDGDDAFGCGDYDGALAFYQQAIFDERLFGWSRGQLWPDSAYGGSPTPTPDPDERARLSAYSRYKITLLHTVRGFMPEAEIVYGTLQELFPAGTPGFPYAELARKFWEAFQEGGDIGTACAAAIEYAAENRAEILAPLGADFYGFGQRAYMPADVCPMG